MGPIDKTGLIQQLFRTIAQPVSPAARATSRTTRQTPASTLQQRIAARLAAIDPAAPDCVPRALDIYVQTFLLDAFGQAIANDPAFDNLRANVVSAIRQSAQFDQLATFIQQQLANLATRRTCP